MIFREPQARWVFTSEMGRLEEWKSLEERVPWKRNRGSRQSDL